jgi:hypothetical protein
MKKMTIAEAAAEILKTAKKPLTAQEITKLILEKGLYTFNTKDEVGMVRRAIHRRCKGYDRKDSISPALFEKTDDKAYILIE